MSNAPSLDSVACRALSLGRSRAAKLAFGVSYAVTGLLAFVGVMIALVGPAPMGLAYALPLVALLGLSYWLRRRADLGAGSVVVDGESLRLQGAKRSAVLRLADVAWGARSDRDAALDLELRNGRRLRVVPEVPSDVDALLTATGTSVDQRAIVLPLRRVIGPFVSGVLWFFAFTAVLSAFASATVLSSAVAVGMRLAAPFLAIALAWLMVWIFRPQLSVGVDGIRYKVGARERFLPHGDVRSIDVERGSGSQSPYLLGLRIVTMAGDTIELPVVGWSETDIDRVLVRVREASASLERGGDARATEAFARRSRALPEWRAEVLRAVSSEGGFRHMRVSIDEAEGVLADPKAPLDTRVGAALALSSVSKESAQPLIRIAASASVDPLAERALLATLADDEDEAIDEALVAAEKSAQRAF